MAIDPQSLIRDLTAAHQKQPFWKQRRVLLGLWFGIYLSTFVIETALFPDLKMTSSLPFLVLLVFGGLLSWFFFTTNLNEANTKAKPFLLLLISIIGVAFAYDVFLSELILSSRGPAVTHSDVRCFNHIVLSSLIPVALFPFFLKNFFVTKIYWALAFLGVHISFMSIAAMELKCHDRELWHLILGHQSSHLAVFGLMVLVYFIRKKLTSLAA